MKALYGAVFGAACVLAASATSASAEIACNEEGDCWHITKIYKYRPEFRVTIYPDDWKWDERESRRYRWREHEGRGYWRDDVWIDFDD